MCVCNPWASSLHSGKIEVFEILNSSASLLPSLSQKAFLQKKLHYLLPDRSSHGLAWFHRVSHGAIILSYNCLSRSYIFSKVLRMIEHWSLNFVLVRIICATGRYLNKAMSQVVTWAWSCSLSLSALWFLRFPEISQCVSQTVSFLVLTIHLQISKIERNSAVSWPQLLASVSRCVPI